jgi:predicted RNA-binding protein with PUA-like domain
MARRARAWWVTASISKKGGGWHWNDFLTKPKSRRQAPNWGGPDWINSPVSFRRIQDMRRGDHVIAYQAGEGVLGIAQLQSRGYRSRGSDQFDTFDLRSESVFQFRQPIPLNVIRALPNATDTFEFVRALRGTVFTVEPGGFERVVCLGAAFNPELGSRLLRLCY